MNASEQIRERQIGAPEPVGEATDLIDALFQLGREQARRFTVYRDGRRLSVKFRVRPSERERA